ncbi:MAG: AraC family ligand binding domain-containing protein, partial [Bacteroidota bacterium]
MSEQLSPRRPTKTFDIQQMEVLHERARDETPHRHDYYTIMFVLEASGTHSIDFKHYTFENGQVHFVSPGQVHHVYAEQRPKGWVITFSREFLASNNISTAFISNLNLFRSFGETPPLPVDETIQQRLLGLVEQMREAPGLLYHDQALGALLQLFLIHCSNSCSLNPQQLDQESSTVCLLRDFKTLVEEHHNEWHKVGEYAEAMFVSPKHLSSSVKGLTGKSAKTVIQDRLIL